MQSLKGQIAVVAGATRGAGRGIACMLGEAGATPDAAPQHQRMAETGLAVASSATMQLRQQHTPEPALERPSPWCKLVPSSCDPSTGGGGRSTHRRPR